MAPARRERGGVGPRLAFLLEEGEELHGQVRARTQGGEPEGLAHWGDLALDTRGVAVLECEPHCREPVPKRLAITPSVLFEGPPITVELEAVELDDERTLDHEVDFTHAGDYGRGGNREAAPAQMEPYRGLDR